MTNETSDEIRSMDWKPTATSFTIERWFFGHSAEKRPPTFRVTWENSWGEEDADGNETPDEGEADFATLDEAFGHCRQLLAANDEANGATT